MTRLLYITGFLGLLASIGVGIGEFMIHFNPEGLASGKPYGYFLGIADSRLAFGHFIMVPFIPLYIVGYYHLYLALKPGSKKMATALLILGVYAFVIGGIWVGSRAYFGHVIQLTQGDQYVGLHEELINNYELLVESLVQLLRVIVLLISVVFVWTILKGGTLYPKWMVCFAPIFVLLLVFALFFFVRPIGQYLAPTAMNVSHAVLFGSSLFALSRSTSRLTNS